MSDLDSTAALLLSRNAPKNEAVTLLTTCHTNSPERNIPWRHTTHAGMQRGAMYRRQGARRSRPSAVRTSRRGRRYPPRDSRRRVSALRIRIRDSYYRVY